MEGRTVGQVAEATGVTVRALHHYDEIGLLVPSGRSAAGYRLYSEDDLARLHAICTYRELGLSLDQIGELLDDGSPLVHLRRQHAAVSAQLDRLNEIKVTLETMLEAAVVEVSLSPEETFSVFGSNDPNENADEAHERWGDTDAYRESARRVRRYGVDEWRAIKAESDEIERGFATVAQQGLSPDAPAALEWAERHRQHIDRWFYPCPSEMHLNLAYLYVADARFAEHYNRGHPGLAIFVSASIRANATAG
jgi:DNA-binding transcriptional MerR regulator